MVKRAFEKYGRDNFKKEIMWIFDTKEMMYQCEAIIVDLSKVSDSMCYNIRCGGLGGWDHCITKDSYKKASKTRKANNSKMTKEERQKIFSRDTKGSNNPRALQVTIYDSKGEVQYECDGDFKNIIEDNNLPSKQLVRSLQNGGEPIYTFSRQCSETRVRNKFGNDYVDKYKGWYVLDTLTAYK